MLKKIEPTYSSQERNEKLSIKAKERFQNSENHPMYGKHMSEESKRKNSESHKGKKPSNETRMKLSESRIGSKNPNYGKTISDEQRKKLANQKKVNIAGKIILIMEIINSQEKITQIMVNQ